MMPQYRCSLCYKAAKQGKLLVTYGFSFTKIKFTKLVKIFHALCGQILIFNSWPYPFNFACYNSSTIMDRVQ